MSDPSPATRASADTVLRALRKTRQVRQFTPEPVAEADLQAILEVARWSGSSINRQPWTFIVIRDRAELVRLAELAPHAKHVAGAAVAIAVAMSGQNPGQAQTAQPGGPQKLLFIVAACGRTAASVVVTARPDWEGID